MLFPIFGLKKIFSLLNQALAKRSFRPILFGSLMLYLYVLHHVFHSMMGRRVNALFSVKKPRF